MPAFPILRHPLARFLLIMVGVYALWLVIYNGWIEPDGRLDEWISLNVAAMAGGILKLFGTDVLIDGRIIYVVGAPGVGANIVDECNALPTLGLFIGFVLAFPGTWKNRLWFIPLGLLIIHTANVLRVSFLVGLQQVRPEWFDFVHVYGTPPFFYLVTFVLWVIWANMGKSVIADSKVTDDESSGTGDVVWSA